MWISNLIKKSNDFKYFTIDSDFIAQFHAFFENLVIKLEVIAKDCLSHVAILQLPSFQYGICKSLFNKFNLIRVKPHKVIILLCLVKANLACRKINSYYIINAFYLADKVHFILGDEKILVRSRSACAFCPYKKLVFSGFLSQSVDIGPQ